MGDIADMMLEGTLCEGCGDFLGDSECYPRRCPYCQSEESERALEQHRNDKKH